MKTRVLESECVCAQLLSPTLCDPIGYSPPGSSVHGISWKEYWSGLPIPLPGDSQPWDQTQVSCISCNGRQILYQWATWEDLESESPGQILALPLLDLYKDNNAHWEGLCEDKGQDGWSVPLGWSATSELNTCCVPFHICFHSSSDSFTLKVS